MHETLIFATAPRPVVGKAQEMAQANAQERDYYTVPEAARALDVSPSTVWRWIEAKKLPAYRVGARKIRIKKEDLRTVVTPARREEPGKSSTERHGFVPPTEEELARRRAAVERILASRIGRSIAPLTTSDLIHQVREEREEPYRSWLGMDRPEIGEPRLVDVAPGSELDRLLDDADGAPLLLVKDGVRYWLEREERVLGASATRDPWADYDSERLRAGIEAAAGSISEEEAKRRIADIYRWREEGSRPPDRP